MASEAGLPVRAAITSRMRGDRFGEKLAGLVVAAIRQGFLARKG